MSRFSADVKVAPVKPNIIMDASFGSIFVPPWYSYKHKGTETLPDRNTKCTFIFFSPKHTCRVALFYSGPFGKNVALLLGSLLLFLA